MKKLFTLLAVILMGCCSAVAQEAATIQITVGNVASTQAQITFSPSDPEAYYYLSVMETELYSELTEAEVVARCKEELDYLVSLYATYGMNFSYKEFSYSGEKSGTYTRLTPETHYTAFAYFIDINTGEALSAVASAEFYTPAIGQSVNKITLNFNAETNKIVITTTTDDPYIFWLEPQEEFDEYQDIVSSESVEAELNDWINAFEQSGITNQLLRVGNQEIDCNEFYTSWKSKTNMETGDYIAMAAPYSVAINGSVAYTQFSYVAPEVVITDTVALHVVDPEWQNAVASQGWWQIMGNDVSGEYFVSLSNTFNTQIAGTYETEDMDMEYSFVGIVETDQSIYFSNVKVEVTTDNDVICVSAEADGMNGIHYSITFDPIDANAVRGEQYDTEDDVETAFATDDIVGLELNEGYAYLRCEKQDEEGMKEMMAILFYVDGQELPAGTYPVDKSYQPGTVQACSLSNGSIYPSFWGVLNAAGSIQIPLFYFTEGTVTVAYDAQGNLMLDAEVSNTWGASGKFTVNAQGSGIQNLYGDEQQLQKKMLKGGRIIIQREERSYNALGVELR